MAAWTPPKYDYDWWNKLNPYVNPALEQAGAFESFSPEEQWRQVSSALGWGTGRSGNPYRDYLQKMIGQNSALWGLQKQSDILRNTGTDWEAGVGASQPTYASYLGQRYQAGSGAVRSQPLQRTRGGVEPNLMNPTGGWYANDLENLKNLARSGDITDSEDAQINNMVAVLGQRRGLQGRNALKAHLQNLYGRFSDESARNPDTAPANFYTYAMRNLGMTV